MKRHNFRGLRASHGVSVSHRSHGSTGNRQDPGRVFKGKKMAGHMGHRQVTVQNLEVFGVDPDRGLILVKGGVPGPEGRLPAGHRRGEERPAEAGAVPGRGGPPGRGARGGRRRRGRGVSDAGADQEPRRRGGGLARARRCHLRRRGAAGHPAPRGALAARQAPGGHAQGEDPGRDHPHRRQALQAEGRRPRAARLAAGQHLPRRRRGASARMPRDHAIDLPKKVRALGLQMRALEQGGRGQAAWCWTTATLAEPKTKALAGALREARPGLGAGRSPAPRSSAISASPRATCR